MKKTLSLLAILGCLGASVAFGGDDDLLEQDAKAQVTYFKKNAKRAKNVDMYAQLLMEMASIQHPIVVKQLGKSLLKEKDLERRMIISATLGGFTANDETRDAAGEALVKAITETKRMEDELLENCTHAIGKLEYKPAVPLMADLVKDPQKIDPWVMVTTIRALAKCDDWRALPVLLKLWEFTAKGYSWETGEVTVDTGASGTADQDAAEAAWNAKYGMVKSKGKPPVDLKVYAEEVAKAAAKITKEKLSNALELRAWMEARIEKLTELGIEIPEMSARMKKKLKDDEKAKKKGKRGSKSKADE